jgi:hypothetical protein
MGITAKQREARKARLGGSDMPALFGLDPYRTGLDVYVEKTAELEELEPNPAMEVGTFIETGVLHWATQQLGPLKRNQYRSAEGLPIGSHVDALTMDAAEAPVEAKTAGLLGPLPEGWGEGGTDQIPDHVLVQAQVHILCCSKNGSGPEVCHVPALLGGRGFRMYATARNPKLIEMIGHEALEFWAKHVVPRVPPDLERYGKVGLEVLQRIKRAPGTSVSVNPALVTDWLEAKAAAKEAKEAAEGAYKAVLAALGDAEGGDTPKGVLTYLAQRGAATVDRDALRADGLFDKYCKPGKPYRVLRWKQRKETAE